MPPTDLPRLHVPCIDAHTHVFHDRPGLARLLAEGRLRIVVVNITGARAFAAPMAARWEAMCALKERYPKHVALCTTFDPRGIGEAGFAEHVTKKLRADLDRGAAMVKVWKDIGLEVKDGGRHVQIDDGRFRPIWDFLAEEHVPVLAHIAEPRAAWQPLDRKSPHYRYYRDHPAYHLHGREDVPTWEAIIASRDRWIEQNPGLTIIGAHLGSMACDVGLVAERLERYPNFHVDTAERFGDLATQPSEKVCTFFTRYADRILYGTDVIMERPLAEISEGEAEAERAGYERLLAAHVRYLAGDGTIEIQDKLARPVHVRALNLGEGVLRHVLHDNAARLIGF